MKNPNSVKTLMVHEMLDAELANEQIESLLMLSQYERELLFTMLQNTIDKRKASRKNLDIINRNLQEQSE